MNEPEYTLEDGMRDHVEEVLTADIASEKDGSPDFILRQGDDLVYVDVEGGAFYLISVRKSHAVVAASTRANS